MRHILFILLLPLLTLQGYAENDSTVLVKAPWKSIPIAKGAVWKSYHFDNQELFKANEAINFIEIRPAAKRLQLKVATTDSLQKTSLFMKESDALAAINGSFFRMRGADPDTSKSLTAVPNAFSSKAGKNRSVTYLRINNVLVTDNEFKKPGKRGINQLGAVAINHNVLSVLQADKSNPGWESSLAADDIMTSGPMLLTQGREDSITNDAFSRNRHPRTAVGKKADGTIVLFVVDGRTSSSYGMSLKELQQTLRWLGCKDALNLDGGGSTTMTITGQPFEGVVNYPCDNKLFDHEGERDVANAILLLKK